MGRREQEADPVDAVMRFIGFNIVCGIITALIVFVVIPTVAPTPPKPREYPAWCHIERDMTASGLCKNIPGLWWAV